MVTYRKWDLEGVNPQVSDHTTLVVEGVLGPRIRITAGRRKYDNVGSVDS
jgi:hypothetical protein